jgi:hypothetical protein
MEFLGVSQCVWQAALELFLFVRTAVVGLVEVPEVQVQLTAQLLFCSSVR